MQRKQLTTGVWASIGMLILIMDGQTALTGARTGIQLCMKTVVPSLFPFFVLSILLTNAFSGSSLSLLKPLGKFCGIPRGAEAILIAGFLGGYPVGAQSIASAYRSGQLLKADAHRMLAFCNNAGPAFLFGMVSSLFSSPWAAWILWGIHIFSAFLVSRLIPAAPSIPVKASKNTGITVSDALRSAIRVMAAVCGWAILFRVLIAFLSRWMLWLLPNAARVALIGLLELSNGCCELVSVEDPSLRFILCSGMLAFGGMCVAMQTHAVTGELSMKNYYVGKLLQTAFSLLFSCAVAYRLWLLLAVVGIMSAVMFRKWQKRSSIPAAVGV